jgi:hypothetical protein
MGLTNGVVGVLFTIVQAIKTCEKLSENKKLMKAVECSLDSLILYLDFGTLPIRRN